MNQQIRKEFHSLWPAFGVSLLAIAVTAYAESNAIITSFLLFPLCASLLAAIVFGSEYQARTMPLLLLQPISRRHLWYEKMGILALLLLLMGLAFVLLILSHKLNPAYGRTEDLNAWRTQAILNVLWVLIGAFCTVPCLTLWFRNQLLAMLLAFAIPFFLFMVLFFLPVWTLNIFSSRRMGYLFLIYCAGMYWLGYRKFLNYEDMETKSWEIKLPARIGDIFADTWNAVLPRRANPLAALVRKELELQRASFVIAGVICVLSVVCVAAWKIHPSGILNWGRVGLIVYMVIIPFMTGVTCVADERNSGTLGWQLTLPIHVRTQWLVKISVALAVCLVLGIILPLILSVESGTGVSAVNWHETRSGEMVFWLCGILTLYLAFFSLVVFASSVSSTSISAIVMTIGLSIACLTAVFVTFNYLNPTLHGKAPFGLHPANDEFKNYLPFFGVFVLVIYFIAYANYRQLEVKSGRKWLQLFGILLLVEALTVAARLIL